MAPPLKLVKDVEDMTTSAEFTNTHPAVILCSFPMNSQFIKFTDVFGKATRLGTLWFKFFGRDLYKCDQLHYLP